MDSQEILQSILNTISDGVMAVDTDWRIMLWNDAAETITGFPRDEVLAKKCMRVFRSPLCKEHCLLERALSCRHPYRDVEALIHNRRNQVTHLLVSAAPLYDAAGNIIGGLETFRDVSRCRWMQEELQTHFGFREIVGQSQAMAKVFEAIESLLDTDTTVLLQGESGTGKELIARALHFYGPRKEKSFTAINCSAIPEGMLESELFGHAKGAFTGAVRTHIGKLEVANGGTLFLDEVSEISPSVQVKLLRVIEEREFQRLGDNRNIRVDIRLMTATNQNLYKEMLRGNFREDLYYRLSVFPLDLPPLRERMEDVPLLVSYFLSKFNKLMGKKIRGLADGVLDILETYTWPGNVRELANAVEYALVHCKGPLILPTDLPEVIQRLSEIRRGAGTAGLHGSLQEAEREIILKVLQEANWKRSVAAKRLGISLPTLWRKMEKYSIRHAHINSEKAFQI